MIFADLKFDGETIGRANLLCYPPIGSGLWHQGNRYVVTGVDISEPSDESFIRDRAVIELEVK